MFGLLSTQGFDWIKLGGAAAWKPTGNNRDKRQADHHSKCWQWLENQQRMLAKAKFVGNNRVGQGCSRPRKQHTQCAA